MIDPNQYFLRAMYPQDDQPIPSSKVIIIHSLEAPVRVGLVRSLQSGWMRTPGEQASAHAMSGPDETVQCMDYSLTCWHCGNGNQRSTGHEQCGYAGWSVDEWNAPEVDPSLRNLARSVAWEWVHRVMPDYGVNSRPQWLSLAQLAAGDECGLATHNDARLVWGGTTHWDPGPNYPFGKVLRYVHQEIDKLLGVSAPTSAPTSDSAPTQDWIDMATLPQVKALLAPLEVALAHLTLYVDGNPPARNGAANRMLDSLAKIGAGGLWAFTVNGTGGIGVMMQGWIGMHSPAEAADFLATFRRAGVIIPQLGTLTPDKVTRWFGPQR